MKILLMAPSYHPQVNSAYFPLGLAYVASYTKARGYDVDGLNLNHYPDPDRYTLLMSYVESGQYDVIGITGLTVCFNEIEKLIETIRNVSSETPIVLGGGITSCEGELVMRTLKPDYMVVNEGEVIFVNLLKAISGEYPASSVAGIWCWMGDMPFYTGKGPEVGDLNTLEEPDLDLLDIERHIAIQGDAQVSYHLVRYDMGKSMPVLASRSCPFKCTFCHHAGMGKYKRHDIARVVDQIEGYIRKYKVSCVSIYDELFSANRARIKEFCELLLEKQLKIKWFCQLRVDQLDQELLELMKSAGCNYISFGFESGSDTVLDSMKKKIKAVDIANAVKMSRKANVGFQANFLFGDPAESMETVQESLHFQQENELYFTDWSAVIPYAGTQIFDYAFNEGLIEDKVAFIRSQCNISTYLYKHQINMTRMNDEQYADWYIKLREINDLNHRKRLVRVKSSEYVDGWFSKLIVECPSCLQEVDTNFRYPLEAGDEGHINRDAPIGMLGVNILCPSCCRKMHLAAVQIPHIENIFTNFQKRVDQLACSGTEVVILPAMDRYFSVFCEDISLRGLQVTAVLDSRENRIGECFMGQITQALERDSVQENIHAVFLILPWVEYRAAMDLLLQAGVSSERILSWNQSFTLVASNEINTEEHQRQFDAMML